MTLYRTRHWILNIYRVNYRDISSEEEKKKDKKKKIGMPLIKWINKGFQLQDSPISPEVSKFFSSGLKTTIPMN